MQESRHASGCGAIYTIHVILHIAAHSNSAQQSCDSAESCASLILWYRSFPSPSWSSTASVREADCPVQGLQSHNTHVISCGQVPSEQRLRLQRVGQKLIGLEADSRLIVREADRMSFRQLTSHSGLEDLLVHRLVPGLRLHDLQSVAACCRGFQAFVEALPQGTWTAVAR